MKNNLKSTKINKNGNLSTFILKMRGMLTQNEMLKIKGGDGEGNGGVDIIIIPKP